MSRASGRWKPFATTKLSLESQRYAVRALRAAFAWLVNVRYLAGNPWTAVSDPIVVQREDLIKVERALPPTLWQRIRAHTARLLRPSAAAAALLRPAASAGCRVSDSARTGRVWRRLASTRIART